MPKVSVIVPNYNHAPYLVQRFESIFNQTFQDFEVIILDDCSTDNSREVLEKFRNHPKVSQVLYNEKNSGSPFKQWNKGVSLARGEYIWIAESDDEAANNFLQILVPKLEVKSDVGIAYSQSLRINEKSEAIDSMRDIILGGRFKKYDHSFMGNGRDECADLLFLTNTIPNASGVVFRKEKFKISGGACEGMKLCGDWMTWVNMLLVSDLYFHSQELNFFRFHQKSVRETTAPSKFLIEKSLIQTHILQNIHSTRRRENIARLEFLQALEPLSSQATCAWFVKYCFSLEWKSPGLLFQLPFLFLIHKLKKLIE